MNKFKRVLSIILILTILSYIFINFINVNDSYAAGTISSDINGINEAKYPGIKSAIQSLQSQHPNWNFQVLYTGLNWSDAITAEYTGHSAAHKNQVEVSSSYQGDWVCSVCGSIYHKDKWYGASWLAIEYMMDPRNSLDNTSVFQFEKLDNSVTAYVGSAVSGTFLQGHEAEIVNAANATNMNVYFVLARLFQEQSKSGSVLTSGAGYNGQYVGYYNPFNIAAAGATTSSDIINGLAYAQRKGWDSLEKGLIGGIEFIKTYYINKGQTTLYLQKFDVDSSDGSLYENQYMQNILAAENEGRTLRNYYINAGTYETAHTFIIPLYENMPSVKVSRPSTSNTSANTQAPVFENLDLIKINSSNKLRVRVSPTGDTLTWVNGGEILVRLEKATSKINGTYWDKIRLSSGEEGYVARETYEYESVYKEYLIDV